MMERRLYIANRPLKGKVKTYKKGDFVILRPEKARPLVEKGSLTEVDAVEAMREAIASYGGLIIVESSILGESVAFCLKEKKNGLKGIVAYTEDELALLLLSRPGPQSLRLIHETKKITGGVIIN